MPNWTLSDHDIEVAVALSPEGELTMEVRHAGRVVVAPSRLGLRAAHEDLSTGLAFEAISGPRRIDESYRTVIGKRREHRHTATEWTLAFAKGAHRLDLQVRVADQGVAYRYSVPWTGPVTVMEEVSEYVLAADARAVLLPYENGRSDYEEIHHHTTVGAAEHILYGYPSLFRTGDSWLLVTESNLDSTYAGSRLRFDGRAFKLDLPDPYVTAASPLVTPWRTTVIGADLAAIVESDLVTGLAAPSRVEDTGWIRPGAAAWSWWSDGPSTRDLDAQKRWVDFAAANGWPYLLADAGWNKEWMPELIAYARERGVGVWLWSHWQHVDTELEHRQKLALWKEWGAVGVKIDFTESDGQDRMRWFDSILAATARLQLMVVFHGGTIPRGTERTWPQFMTAEAVKGAEWIKPKPGKLPLYPPEHYLSLAFTRNVQGPMDFTPCTFTAVRTISAGFELALSVLFESGVQHFADGIEAYEARPEALRLLSTVPVAWDETRLLSGDPADHILLARRNGAEWYVGAGVAGEARTLTVPLDFLDDGEWAAEIHRDAPGDLIHTETVTVAAGSKLDLAVAPNGGFTLHLRKEVS
ncbi:glycoside hydrolase family 97 protein [Nonomuraea jiangxiensis]|uniref:Glycosyl-hydrolase 97 C-terminal, oligomerisation n=1 Tax=Nonomuraea jiangxiensis TaxID=633440 RepID=A0A1G7ZLX7_9ACTN|nr:glycoside hydrolase family 97 protein [Nonomuraea jiangxiensis]SDH09566.1 Glycosyl-hydrolase 97 C-terminal, oligomerisation [Nonomuraea jiangxiensis]